VTWQDVVDSIGSWVFLGTALVILAGLAAGRLAAVGSASADGTVLALATAQRNVSAALVVAASLGTDTVVRTLVAALVIPVVLIVTAGELGRRARGGASDPPQGDDDVGDRGEVRATADDEGPTAPGSTIPGHPPPG
jgi:BASS family bile acid:Na+ symporter